MTDERSDPHPDSPPKDPADERSEIERVVEDTDGDPAAAHDAPDALTDPGMPDGVGGTGGVTRNQDDDAQ